GENFHSGVTGIVASRLVEQYGRPAIVVTNQDGEGKGSGRSVEGFHLHEAITACKDLLIRYGGHALAAGLSVRQENLEALRRRLNDWAAKTYPVPVQPPLRLDVPVKLEDLTVEEVQGLDYLAPCGHGNPAPLFLVENAVVDGVFPMGDSGRHSRVRLRQGISALYAAYFGVTPAQIPYGPGDRVDAAVALSVFEGRSGPMLSGRIRALRPAGLGNEAARQAALYEAFRCGAALTAQQRAVLKPQRSDTVAVYRKLQSGAVFADDLQPLFAQLGAGQTGKTLVSLEALTQLDLITVRQVEGVNRFALVPTKEKKDLTSAPILRAMEE
ncbi:MAG: single-stranded-DNA-specific exonuclease RecJ, partial [Oscillospiraceae bacterium]|nr:single-stranded-DNA-specific exonuclease RecJ [Oscillospiraceae bacterium]